MKKRLKSGRKVIVNKRQDPDQEDLTGCPYIGIIKYFYACRKLKYYKSWKQKTIQNLFDHNMSLDHVFEGSVCPVNPVAWKGRW